MKKLPKPYKPTTKARVRSILRGQVWMKSPERSEALKRSGYCCERCGKKLSRAKSRDPETTVDKLDVHHIDGIDWGDLSQEVIDRILPDPSRLMPVCKPCHTAIHKEEDDEKA